ncbi:hypothetical protein PC118_g13482 [Phytophthora cactorum]|uniref:Uncharacterized protein n=1 Tax=Phytophthora cactorum TaxID=29920 RepID=A0A8T1FPH2_9STRA|nr:hypothetical protein PC115_g12907 [Phytophthora cactorum]KAG2976300.1 hypothetical protein PC118_g13482 [Phytophthora cactorum]
MSETTEGEGTDEGESVQFNSYDGLANLFASPAPSTTGTIDSREEVRYCDEWDLFADAALDQHEASDSENSTDDHSDDENDEPGTRDLNRMIPIGRRMMMLNTFSRLHSALQLLPPTIMTITR